MSGVKPQSKPDHSWFILPGVSMFPFPNSRWDTQNQTRFLQISSVPSLALWEQLKMVVVLSRLGSGSQKNSQELLESLPWASAKGKEEPLAEERQGWGDKVVHSQSSTVKSFRIQKNLDFPPKTTHTYPQKLWAPVSNQSRRKSVGFLLLNFPQTSAQWLPRWNSAANICPPSQQDLSTWITLSSASSQKQTPEHRIKHFQIVKKKSSLILWHVRVLLEIVLLSLNEIWF